MSLIFPFPRGYPTAAELEASFRELSADGGASERVIGHSHEGRPIWAFEIGPERAPVVLLTALIHGVELVGSLALREVFARLLRSERRISEKTRFVVVPIVNPDAFAENSERLLGGRRAFRRCNRAGVDLNRNFPVLGKTRLLHPFSGSRCPALPHYRGPHPFSEPETRAVRDALSSAPPALSLGFHSFGNLLLYPWGFTREKNPRSTRYRALGSRFLAALRGARYGLRQSSSFYPTHGDLDDWLDATFGTLAFTVEVGAFERRLFASRRLTNPFFWHNPSGVTETVSAVVPGVLALLSEAPELRS